MAKEGRGLISIIFKNFINSFKPQQWRGREVGKDYKGNVYFEIPREEAGRRPSRWYKPPGGDEDLFDKELPAEWESWLRLRRKHPPTEKEIEENLALMRDKKKKAAEIDKKFGVIQDNSKSFEFPVYQDLEQHPGKRPVKKEE